MYIITSVRRQSRIIFHLSGSCVTHSWQLPTANIELRFVVDLPLAQRLAYPGVPASQHTNMPA